MTTPTPRISVLMSAYNVERYIGEAISSVLAQTFTDFELIVVNDGSTDRTEDVVRSFTDPRICLVSQPNEGIAAALNHGLRLARAPLIARFDADDICYPRRLEQQYHFLTTHPDYLLVGTAAKYIDERGEYVFTHRPPALTNDAVQALKKQICPFIHSSVLYRKDPILACGGYCAHAHSFEDHLLWVEVLKRGKGCNLPEPLVQVRLNPGSLTIDERWRTRRFLQLKAKVLRTESITAEEGAELLRILRQQDNRRIKEGAYYALLSKKYLWNNYQPGKARTALRRVLALNRTHWSSYLYYLVTFFPQPVLQRLYRLAKTNNYHGR
jgi:glycosyltransferase involved in cell wall biosynthesis